jgi:hypothetical protein
VLASDIDLIVPEDEEKQMMVALFNKVAAAATREEKNPTGQLSACLQ